MPAGDRCGAKFRPLQLFLISGMELFLISGVIMKTPLLQNTCAEHGAESGLPTPQAALLPWSPKGGQTQGGCNDGNGRMSPYAQSGPDRNCHR
jgi:hypothetical protein